MRSYSSFSSEGGATIGVGVVGGIGTGAGAGVGVGVGGGVGGGVVTGIDAGAGVSASGWAHPATRSISISPPTSNLLSITISPYRDQAMLSGAQQVFYEEIQNYLFNFLY